MKWAEFLISRNTEEDTVKEIQLMCNVTVYLSNFVFFANLFRQIFKPSSGGIIVWRNMGN
jgi:hypothetical protein